MYGNEMSMFMNVWTQILTHTCLQKLAYCNQLTRPKCYTLGKNRYVCTLERVLFVCYGVEIHKNKVKQFIMGTIYKCMREINNIDF